MRVGQPIPEGNTKEIDNMPTDIRIVLWVVAAAIIWLALTFGMEWPE